MTSLLGRNRYLFRTRSLDRQGRAGTTDWRRGGARNAYWEPGRRGGGQDPSALERSRCTDGPTNPGLAPRLVSPSHVVCCGHLSQPRTWLRRTCQNIFSSLAVLLADGAFYLRQYPLGHKLLETFSGGSCAIFVSSKSAVPPRQKAATRTPRCRLSFKAGLC